MEMVVLKVVVMEIFVFVWDGNDNGGHVGGHGSDKGSDRGDDFLCVMEMVVM